MTDKKLNCICGKGLRKLCSHLKVHCNGCHKQIESDEPAFSCGWQFKIHPNGYDLCEKCHSKYTTAPINSGTLKLETLGYASSGHEAMTSANDDINTALQILITKHTKLVSSTIDNSKHARHINTYTYNLINGYIKLISSNNKYIIVPTEIKCLIIQFYGISAIDNALIVFKRHKYQYIKEARNIRKPTETMFHDLRSNRYYFSNCYNIQKDHQFIGNTGAQRRTVITNCSLPPYFKNMIQETHSKKIKSLLSSNHWNLLFEWNFDHSYATVINSRNTENIYNVPIPQGPVYATTYSRSKQQLFKVIYNKILFLNPNPAANTYQEQWKLVTCNGFNALNNAMRRGTSANVCMVDNDRFIFGTFYSGQASLYALNSDKCIDLQSRNHDWRGMFSHGSSYSVYHKLYHKIIIASNGIVE
eukprot:393805_1